MIFFLFLLSLIVIQRIVSSAAKVSKLKLPEPPVTDLLSSPETTEYHLPTGLLNLSHAIEQNAPSTTTRHEVNPALKNTAQ